MCGWTCFERLPAHHQEHTTAIGASGFTVGRKQQERCWSWSGQLKPARPRPTTLQPFSLCIWPLYYLVSLHIKDSVGFTIVREWEVIHLSTFRNTTDFVILMLLVCIPVPNILLLPVITRQTTTNNASAASYQQ